MPPPHLHPRSRMTSSLFATTVLASFFVVALPHVLPCPAPRVKFADGHDDDVMGDAPPRRRRRRRPVVGEEVDVLAEKTATATATATAATAPTTTPPGLPAVQRGDGGLARFALVQTDSVDGEKGQTGLSATPRTTRECPVPKPGGIVGELLGFKTRDSPSSRGEDSTERPS